MGHSGPGSVFSVPRSPTWTVLLWKSGLSRASSLGLIFSGAHTGFSCCSAEVASPGAWGGGDGGGGGHIVVLSSLCLSAGETQGREADEQEKLGRRPPTPPNHRAVRCRVVGMAAEEPHWRFAAFHTTPSWVLLERPFQSCPLPP